MRSILSSVSPRYKNESYKIRFHNFIRARTCPFEKIAEYIYPFQNVLDLGCGNGLFADYLSVTKHPLYLTGIDLSKSNIDSAQRSSGVNENLLFITGDISDPENAIGNKREFDRILAIDSLYFLPVNKQRKMIEQCRGLLKESGALLIKTIDRKPLWKYWFCAIQDRIAMSLFRLYPKKDIHVLRAPELQNLIFDSGFTRIKKIYIGKGYLYPHILYVCQK